MANATLRQYAFFVLVLIALIIATLLWNQQTTNGLDAAKTPPSSTSQPTAVDSPRAPESQSAAHTMRVADAWVGAAPVVDQTAPSAQTQLDEAFIYRALSEVKIDEVGNLIIDHDGLEGLYATLGYGNQALTVAQLDEIQRIIKEGLPGSAGEQVAKVVSNFYEYLQAKNKIEALYQNPQSASELRTKLADLNMIREMYMGADVATALFAEQQAHENYMLANMTVSLDSELSDEEKAQQRERLAALHLTRQPDVMNWEMRHQAFLDDKQMILESALSPLEKEQQIQQLYNNQFTTAEQQKLSSLNLTEF